ncbi:MAG: DUF882 domain-containing protein [Alphaproteobacteria bacterium]|nr:DUF882 domain-containing protein [Alphaproteobacteria bacterium]
MANPHDPNAPQLLPQSPPSVRRRSVLAGLGGLVAAAAVPLAGPSAARAAAPPAARSLALENLHTGEVCRVVFEEQGVLDPAALAEIARVLRDHRTGEVAEIEPDLLILLSDLRHRLGSTKAVQVISGYRSPKTNAMLAKKSDGVARKSFHMRGMAIDCALPDAPLRALHRAALEARRGGVGLYAKSGFVHLDVGPPRSW